MCILLKSVWNYRKYELISDFFTFIFRTRISLLIYFILNWNFLCAITTLSLREACLKILSYVLVLILCQKTGNFWWFFSLSISTFHKIKTRTYIKILRHTSLHLHLKNTCLKFERCILNIGWDILVQKKLTKYQCFVFTPHYISKYSTQLDLFYIPKLLIK